MARKRIGLMSIYILLACLFVGCVSHNKNLIEKATILANNPQKSPSNSKDIKTKVNESVNALGNISNGGYIACEGEWIYFVNFNTDFKLYKMKLNGENVIKVVNDKVSGLAILNEWIYYSNGSDKGRIYKVKKDGSKRIRLSNDSASFLNVENDWIYYRNNSDKNKIYKVNVDGSKRTKISDDIAGIVNIEKGWIYYNNISDDRLEGDGKIYKIKINGADKTIVCDDYVDFFCIYNNFIYYSRFLHGFYKIKTDGLGKVELDSKLSGIINVAKNYIYYGTDKIQRIGITDNKKLELVKDVEPISINVAGDWIFYIIHVTGDNEGEGYEQMYKIKTDGCCNELLNFN